MSGYQDWTIKETIKRINEGKMFLPALQRKFVWKAGQIIELFDSILRGYPIGTFLFWNLKEVKNRSEKHISGQKQRSKNGCINCYVLTVRLFILPIALIHRLECRFLSGKCRKKTERLSSKKPFPNRKEWGRITSGCPSVVPTSL